jgi:hypothetical protein
MLNNKTGVWMLGLIIAATILNGLLAGGNVDRALVAMPAWHQTGLTGWADFSRNADLGNGRAVYPIMAISGTLLTLAAFLVFLRTGRSPRRAMWPLFIAAALMLVSLPVSFKAAPFMLSLRHVSNDDVAALGTAFAGFEFWGRLQGILHVAAFCANLWSIAAVSRHVTGSAPSVPK